MRSQQQNPADDRTGPARGVGAWAVYLGVSWTWCIGMFLPVLLVRDMGMAGFWVFAVPNVLGAAAMGWIIGNGQASRRITAEHSGACGAFSIVTIWFHLFFAAWFLPKLAGPAGPAVAAGAIVVFLIAGTFRSGSALTAAVVAMISAGAAVVWLYDPPAGVIPPSRLGGTWELTALADVCVFGFLLCPYLDLTFHRARQSLGVGQARAAFTLGFGVVFFGMILFSLAYARPMATVIGSPMALMAQRVRLAIMLHMALQSAFTVAEHARALVDLRGVASAGRRAMMLMGGGTGGGGAGVSVFSGVLWAGFSGVCVAVHDPRVDATEHEGFCRRSYGRAAVLCDGIRGAEDGLSHTGGVHRAVGSDRGARKRVGERRIVA
jgi:hypothetical protein